jgi:hypothetical protein
VGVMGEAGVMWVGKSTVAVLYFVMQCAPSGYIIIIVAIIDVILFTSASSPNISRQILSSNF